ncbi:MAG: DUF2179 domain-containing protein [Acidobacteria bacterium]|nr:DUF2179 domain-containing protein [Acidobacteriota bacterium]
MLSGSFVFPYIVLPLLIVAARVVDVSLGTLRVMLLTRGRTLLAPVLGFFEVLVWLVAIGQILQDLTNVYYYLVYAFGFALGTWVGMWIEQRLALGVFLVRVITHRDAGALIQALKARGIGLTYLDAHGANGTVQLIFTVVRRQQAPAVIELIKLHNPNAFYSVEDVRFVAEPERAFVLPGPRRSQLLRLIKRR